MLFPLERVDRMRHYFPVPQMHPLLSAMKKIPPQLRFPHLLLSFLCCAFLGLGLARGEGDGERPVFTVEDSALLLEQEGNEVTVRGTVTRVGATDDNTVTFLNFGPRAADQFVVVIFARDYEKFPEGFGHLTGRELEVRGTLEIFRNQQPQIRLETPEQLTVLEN
jgi:hypothetical protein